MPSRTSSLFATWLYSDIALEAEQLAELAHRQGLDAGVVHELEGGPQDSGPG